MNGYEINDSRLLGRPIGLFDVARFSNGVPPSDTEFFPDVLFYGAEERHPRSLLSIVSKEFLPRLANQRLRDRAHCRAYKDKPLKFELCPVTRQLIQRQRECGTPRPKVFTSYSHKDIEHVRKLVTELRRRNINVWRDEDNLSPGPWDDEIQREIEACSHVLLVATKDSVNARNVRDELNYAIDMNKIIIPVRYEDCDIPFRINRLTWVDIRHDFETAFFRILKWLSDGEPESSGGG